MSRSHEGSGKSDSLGVSHNAHSHGSLLSLEPDPLNEQQLCELYPQLATVRTVLHAGDGHDEAQELRQVEHVDQVNHLSQLDHSDQLGQAINEQQQEQLRACIGVYKDILQDLTGTLQSIEV